MAEASMGVPTERDSTMVRGKAFIPKRRNDQASGFAHRIEECIGGKETEITDIRIDSGRGFHHRLHWPIASDMKGIVAIQCVPCLQ